MTFSSVQKNFQWFRCFDTQAEHTSTSVSHSKWTLGGEVSSRGPAKSKIPVVAPTSGGVNVEDFRLAVIRGSLESTQRCIDQGVCNTPQT